MIPSSGAEFALAYHLYESEESRETLRRVATRWEGALSRRITQAATDGEAETQPKRRGTLVLLPSGQASTANPATEIKTSLLHRLKARFTWVQGDNTSRWLFPLLFLLCNAVFWTNYEFIPNAGPQNLDCAAKDYACYQRVRRGYGMD
jgi:hypothetical protein